MSSDFKEAATLRPSTSALVYATYAAHGLAMLETLRRPSHSIPLPARATAPIGTGTAATGVGLFLVGAGAFHTPEQLSGTETGDLVTSGVYRWTRNPQYLGYLFICGGTALAGRCTDATILTAIAATAFDRWIRHEEDNLTRVFKDEYARYAATTHRWLGLPQTGAGSTATAAPCPS